jgi:hypothetical protein
VVARLRVVQADAVNEHEHLAESGPAKREVGLDSPDAPRANIDGGSQPQHVRDAVHRQRLDLLPRNNGHRPGHAAEFNRPGSRSHNNRLAKVLRVRRSRPHAEEDYQSFSHRGSVMVARSFRGPGGRMAHPKVDNRKLDGSLTGGAMIGDVLLPQTSHKIPWFCETNQSSMPRSKQSQASDTH